MAEEFLTADTIVERRQVPRLPLKLLLHFQCLPPSSKNQQQRGLTENIGAGGIAVTTNQNLQKGQELKIILYVPQPEKRHLEPDTLVYPEYECLSINMIGRIIWCAPCDKRFITGIQFLEIDEKNRDDFKKFLEDYKIDEPDMNL